jgi:predicted protein tyrosine phosphatase
MTAECTSSELGFRVSICGREEIPEFEDQGITHLLSIDNPGDPTPTPSEFDGVHWNISFNDIATQAEAIEFDATLPEMQDVQQVLDYAESCQQASQVQPVHLLVHCMAGVSRSTAAAYAMISSMFGEGREHDALKHILEIRPQASPNPLMVKHADAILKRNGKMLEAIKRLRDAADGDASSNPATEQEGQAS